MLSKHSLGAKRFGVHVTKALTAFKKLHVVSHISVHGGCTFPMGVRSSVVAALSHMIVGAVTGVVKSMDFGINRPKFKSRFYHLLTV